VTQPGTQRAPSSQRWIGFAVCATFAFLAFSACGRKGPPLPPLLKQPSPPAEMKAERHGDTVDIQFTVPAANSDGTRPANVTRVDVYALTADRALNEAEVLKHGSRIASVPVKAPRDPNQTVEPEEEDEVELQGAGLEPGARAQVEERLTAEVLKPVDVATEKRTPNNTTAPNLVAPREKPLLAPIVPLTTRVYVGVSVTTKGKNGASAHAVVAMIDAPPAPAEPFVTYDEKAIAVTWPPIGAAAGAASESVLESRPLGVSVPTVAYNVYEVSEGTPPALTRLTGTPVKEARLSDSRLAWGERRCYAVRAFVTVGDTSLEGRESPAHCETFIDTFAPAAPTGLQAVPSEGAISLIWDANPERDIRGYVVLRGPVSADALEPLSTEPIAETSFQDHAPTGVRFAYAVQAVDTAGNLSPPSARVEETAR
jgi:predicted small lipoprotein YifL